jgi:hypothetical protein
MLDCLKEAPLCCITSKVSEAIDCTEHYKRYSTSEDECHAIVRVPLVLHTALALELFVDATGQQEPDFAIVRPPPPVTEAVETKRIVNALERYHWVDLGRKPRWDPTKPDDSLIAFVQWLRKCWLRHQLMEFTEVVVPMNERLQFEYASFLQGFGETQALYSVQRQDNRQVITIGIPLFTGAEEQKQWRQILFRIATNMIGYFSEADQQALTQRLNDWQCPVPIQLRYGCIIVVRDDQPSTFSVARETLQLFREESEHFAENVTVKLFSEKTETVNLKPLLDLLSEEVEKLLPVNTNQLNLSLPKLAADRNAAPQSFIDHIPSLEHNILWVWGSDLILWFDVVLCLAAEFGPPVLCSSGTIRNDGWSPKTATFHFVEKTSNIGCLLQLVYKNANSLPDVTLTSAQSCLKNDGLPIRVAVSLVEDGRPKVFKIVNGRAVLNPALVADETKAFVEKIFPRFTKACEIHGLEL